MKTLLILFLAGSALAAGAQPTNAPPPQTEQSFQAQTTVPSRETAVTLQQAKPNEIIAGPVTYSGIAVEVAKTRKPLQLLNPFAPPEYGSPGDNVARDPINGRVLGLKFFAFQFSSRR